MDWATFWTAFAAIATWAAVLVALSAALLAIRQGKKTGEQFLQARYDDARPIMVIISGPSTIETQKDYPTCLKWDTEHQTFMVRNVGKGVALHLRCVLYAPEAVSIRDANGRSIVETDINDRHWWYWQADTVRTDETGKGLDLVRDGIRFDRQIKGKQRGKVQAVCSLNAPAQPVLNLRGEGELARLCRATLTYEDIFHRKHASIFDLVYNSGWQEVALLEDIPRDLDELRERTK